MKKDRWRNRQETQRGGCLGGEVVLNDGWSALWPGQCWTTHLWKPIGFGPYMRQTRSGSVTQFHATLYIALKFDDRVSHSFQQDVPACLFQQTLRHEAKQDAPKCWRTPQVVERSKETSRHSHDILAPAVPMRARFGMMPTVKRKMVM